MIITQVVAQIEEIFADSGVVFTTQTPEPGTPFSTIYIGGDDSAFAEYGSFLGLSEQVDMGNKNASDNAFVFSDMFSPYLNVDEYTNSLAILIAHETAHLLGYEHQSTSSSNSPLSHVAQELYPGPMESKEPLGSLIYDPLVSGTIDPVDEIDAFTIDVDDGQVITILYSGRFRRHFTTGGRIV